jgi:hypothetical protein
LGTSSVDEKLHVVGNIKGVDSSGQGIQFINTTTPYIQALGTSSINDLQVKAKTLQLETGGTYSTTAALFIDTSQRVGVGNTVPSHALTVQGGSVTESQLSLTTNATSILAGNVVGGIDFRSNDNNGIFTAAKIQAIASESHNSGAGLVGTSLVFQY